MTAIALQSHRSHNHPGASALAPGGGAQRLPLNQHLVAGMLVRPVKPSCSTTSGRRGAPKRGRFTRQALVIRATEGTREASAGFALGRGSMESLAHRPVALLGFHGLSTNSGRLA